MDAVDFPYRPIDTKGWRMAMGLRSLEPSQWLEVDARREDELALKRVLLADSPGVVVASEAAGDAPSEELLEEVRRSLSEFHRGVETSPPIDGDHPIVAAARLVQEDLCVLVRSDTWRLSAACVCFPSRWDLTRKIGRTLDEIHGPVPFYDERLSAPVDKFFDRLDSRRSFWRLNWTLLDSPELHQPTAPRHVPSDEFNHWYFRVERQTLRRLERSGAVVFTIRTYVASAKDLVGRYDDFGPALLHSLESAPEEVREYKGWQGVVPRLRASMPAP